MKTNLSPVDYVGLLVASGADLFLVSAYDIDQGTSDEQETLGSLLQTTYSTGRTILVDSGRYESFWLRDPAWTSERFARVLAAIKARLAFCYDNQDPPSDPKAVAEDVEASVLRDQAAFMAGTVLPIVHARPEYLPDAVGRVISRLHPSMVAVAERDLGDGILERAETVRKLRIAINTVDAQCALHLLGTGNPLSILVYVASGADSFDGLEWCQTCTEPHGIFLYHFHQFDLVGEERLNSLPFVQRVLLSNLLYYSQWLSEIRSSYLKGELDRLAVEYVPDRILRRLRAALKGVI